MDDIVARPYQAYLQELAEKNNVIIYLPTGSGKTFIAINLIKNMRGELQKPWGEGGKRSFFLVNNVPLVMQQKKVIEDMCPVRVGGFSSDDGVDYWDQKRWDQELTKYQVIVMTSQILSDMLTHAYIKVEDINLIIFDECHHAVEDHPMRMVMKFFSTCPKEKHPRIVGLTATLLNSNANTLDKVEQELKNLETTFHATIASSLDLNEVLDYSTNPFECVKFHQKTVLTSGAETAIRILNELCDMVLKIKLTPMSDIKLEILEPHEIDITTDPRKIVKQVKNVLTGMIKSIEELGVFGGSIAIVAYTIALELMKRTCLAEAAMFFKMVITHATIARDYLEEEMQDDEGYDKIVKHSNQNVLILLNILKEYNPDVLEKPGMIFEVNKSQKPLSAIIFTKERFRAKVIYNMLKEVVKSNPKDFGFIKHDYIVGSNANPLKKTREQHYEKKKFDIGLHNFCNKVINCMIATSVIEEGIDIPQCSLVVKFDPPYEYRSYIQSKGRSRLKEASFVIFEQKSKEIDFMNRIDRYREIENYLQQTLTGKNVTRESPTDEEIKEELYDDNDIPPFITELGGKLLAAQAPSLINRYCLMLPRDIFSTPAPKWSLVQKDDKKQISLHMPIDCPVKEPIKGIPCKDKKSAKRSASLNGCARLYQIGELHPITMLPLGYCKVDFETDIIRDCFPNWPWDSDKADIIKDGPRPGTKKRVRKHKLMHPKCLKGPGKQVFNKQTFYLHVLEITPCFDAPTDNRELYLYNILNESSGYAFITVNELPNICDFPMYLSVGETKTRLIVNFATLILTHNLFQRVKRFHMFIFDQVLDIGKKFVTYEGEENCMFVVPVKNSSGIYQIDWNFIDTHTKIPELQQPTFDERRNIKVTTESYLGAIVSPWYRGIIMPDWYIVTNVLEYMSPKSHLISDQFSSYEEYYKAKYNLSVVANDQPLLEVRNITTRYNCLLPRASTIKSFNAKTQKLIQSAQGDFVAKGYPEIFVPEFCVKMDFPGAFWFKANMLPSIIHRIRMLLIAEELHTKIAKEAQIGSIYKMQRWEPIETNIEISKNSLLAVAMPEQEYSINRMPCESECSSARPHNTMKPAIKDLRLKQINSKYPWDEKDEPLDLDHNIMSVTLMDIECFDEFVKMPMESPSVTPITSPKHNINTMQAIAPMPLRKVKKIKVLTTKNSKGPELKDLVSAITTIKSNDAFNLERAETLGDSFLKFAATLYLFHKFPTLNEGQLTSIKCRLIGNRNLVYAAEYVNLGGRMKAEVFSPRNDFLLPGFKVPEDVIKIMENPPIRPTFLMKVEFSPEERFSGVIDNNSLLKIKEQHNTNDVEKEPPNEVQISMQCYIGYQAISDKTLADSVEAIIGTYLISGGITDAVKILEWFRILPKQDNFKSYLNKPCQTALTEGKIMVNDLDHLLNYCRGDIERIMNYKFNDAALLLEALSHSSFINNRVTRSYERLEFLGDAILDFLITSFIYENNSNMKPGDLTDLRSALVNNVTFASYVVKLELHKYFCSDLNPPLSKAILDFVEHQKQRKHEIVEDVLYLIEENDCHIATYVEVPKVLGDIFESLAGAIYLDSGGNLEVVWEVYYRIMWKEIESFTKNIPKQPVRMLYESNHLCQIDAPVLTPSDPPKVMVPITVSKDGELVTVHGFGNNKSQAKRAAAKIGLKILNS